MKKIIIPLCVVAVHIAGLVLLSVYEVSYSFIPLIVKVLTAMLFFSIGWTAIVILDIGKHILIERVLSTDKKDRRRKFITQLDLFEKIASVVILFIATAAAFMNFEPIRQLGVSLFASAGIASVVIGFAAQRFMSSLIAGIQLALTQPIRIDDMVVVENEWGWIEEINLTFVVVRTWDKRRLVIPANHFTDTPFENWTRASPAILAPVYIYTDYTIDVDAIRGETTRLLQNCEHWDGQTNVVQVTDATQETMQIRILASAKDGPTAWNLRVYLRERIITFIQRQYPHSLPRTRVVLDRSPYASQNRPNATEQG
jgi:small-conductance mechanosensitive channel